MIYFFGKRKIPCGDCWTDEEGNHYCIMNCGPKSKAYQKYAKWRQ